MNEDEDSDIHVPGAYRHSPVQESWTPLSYLARRFSSLPTFISLNFLAVNLDSRHTHGHRFQGPVNGYIDTAENGGQAVAYTVQQTTVPGDAPRSVLEIAPNIKADYEIYYDQLLQRKRGCPLYLPGPLQELPLQYRRAGTQVGDIGIVYRSGFFDYLFNILHPADHPINSGRVPPGFKHFDFARAVREEAGGRVFGPGSFLASACIRKRTSTDDDSPDADFIFETTANEGAVLVLPWGSKFKDLLSKGGLKEYLADHANEWYSYITEARGRVGISNGDVRLVVGFDKAHSWGIATFACSQEPGCFGFKRPTLRGSFAYTWHCPNGTGNGKSGPPDDEIQDLRQSTDEPPPENQTIFIRTMNFTRRGEFYDDPDSVALEVRPSSSMDEPSNSGLFQGNSSRHPASSGNQSPRGPQVIQQRGLNLHPTDFHLPVMHPSTYLNRFLLEKFPNAKIAITDDQDWISVIREDDLAFPTPTDLCQRIVESRRLSEENGIATFSSTASIHESSLADHVPAVNHSSKPILKDEGSILLTKPVDSIALVHRQAIDGSHSRNDDVEILEPVPEYPRLLDESPMKDQGFFDADIIIAVMGRTGTGKSTLINRIVGAEKLRVGDSLHSCTQEVQAVECLDSLGRRIILVEFPGFDDTHLSDLDTLGLMATWLKQTYQRGMMLSGLLYLHRISDNQMGNSPRRLLETFKNICGEDAFQNVVLVTTMWDEVTPEEGALREMELRRVYWKHMLALGSRMKRSYNTKASAWAIVSEFGPAARRPLRLQKEMVDERKPLSETTAGRHFFVWLSGIIDLIRKAVESLRRKLRRAKNMEQHDLDIRQHQRFLQPRLGRCNTFPNQTAENVTATSLPPADMQGPAARSSRTSWARPKFNFKLPTSKVIQLSHPF